ncbi:MAG: prepilin-type N-terminal cleavage/methylation domain-containing protein, partial [Gemmataceae bacterium]
MCVTKKIAKQRDAFTLVEMLVVIAVILAISALAAAFAPRVNDNQNLSRAVDNLEQWLLTAKMRAKRDGLATGVRFIQVQGDLAGTYSQLQYIQQPDSLSGYPNTKTLTALNGLVTFSGEDFTMGGAVLA